MATWADKFYYNLQTLSILLALINKNFIDTTLYASNKERLLREFHFKSQSINLEMEF